MSQTFWMQQSDQICSHFSVLWNFSVILPEPKIHSSPPTSWKRFGVSFFFLFFLCLAAQGLHCCEQAFSSCSEQGLFSVMTSCFRAHTPVVVVHGLSSCCSRVLEHAPAAHGPNAHSMWTLPGPGITPMSPALADGFLITGPPGKFIDLVFLNVYLVSEICLKDVFANNCRVPEFWALSWLKNYLLYLEHKYVIFEIAEVFDFNRNPLTVVLNVIIIF